MSNGRRWSKADEEYLLQNYGDVSAQEIAQTLDRSFGAVLWKAQTLGLRSTVKRGSKSYRKKRFATPQFKFLKEIPKDMTEFWRELENFQNKIEKLDTWQGEVDIKINVTQPIGLACLSDAHIGALTGRYKELRETVELIAKIPNLYLISVGDTLDNYLPEWHAHGMFEAIIPPRAQKRLVEWLYQKLAGRWLAYIQGCHDESSMITDDFDWTLYLTEQFNKDESRCANLGFGGFINLTVGKQKYRIGAWHKVGRFNSAFNLTHVVKRAREQIGDFDIVVAHNHRATI